MYDPIMCTFFSIENVCSMHFVVDPPIKISLLIVCVMKLLIDRALTAIHLPTIRQQLVEAKIGPNPLACTSSAPQLHLAG